jgi:hypothetical protein
MPETGPPRIGVLPLRTDLLDCARRTSHPEREGLSINGLNRAIADVSGRARENRLQTEDLGTSTFTIDNTGAFGSIMPLPLINVPRDRRPDHGDDPAGGDRDRRR